MSLSAYQSSARSGIHSGGASPARKSFEQFGRSYGASRSALRRVTDPSKPSRRSISAAAKPAAPPPAITTRRGPLPAAFLAGWAGAGAPTTILPSFSVTSQRPTGSIAGARSASPVRRQKRAWCQGQRTWWPTSSPSANGPW